MWLFPLHHGCCHLQYEFLLVLQLSNDSCGVWEQLLYTFMLGAVTQVVSWSQVQSVKVWLQAYILYSSIIIAGNYAIIM